MAHRLVVFLLTWQQLYGRLFCLEWPKLRSWPELACAVQLLFNKGQNKHLKYAEQCLLLLEFIASNHFEESLHVWSASVNKLANNVMWQEFGWWCCTWHCLKRGGSFVSSGSFSIGIVVSWKVMSGTVMIVREREFKRCSICKNTLLYVHYFFLGKRKQRDSKHIYTGGAHSFHTNPANLMSWELAWIFFSEEEHLDITHRFLKRYEGWVLVISHL